MSTRLARSSRLLGLFALALVCLPPLAGCAAQAGEEDDDLAGEDDALSTSNEAAVTAGGAAVVAHFVNPDTAPHGADTTATDEVKRLLLSAPRGATVRMAIYNITLLDVAKAIVKAQDEHGVDVHIVGDGQILTSKSPAAVYLRKHVKKIHLCTEASGGRGCIPRDADGLMHAKWMTLSGATDTAGTSHQNVTWFGSANLTGATGQESFNDTITVYDDAQLYAGFAKYFSAVHDQAHVKNDDFYNSASGRGYFHSATASVFASPEQNTDLVYARLNDITPGAGCVIRVAQASFHDSRKNLAHLLASHKKKGCKVGVVVGEDAHGTADIGTEALATLRAAHVTVRSRAHIHSKLVLVRANYGGQTREVVYTGSHNWTKLALRQDDEIFVRMADNHDLFRAYVGHFNDQYRSATRVP